MPAKILVADDEPDVLFMTAFTLRQLGGFDVIEARNGQEALELLEQHQPDLMVLDVQMPRMTGYEVCRCVRQHATLSHTPVILLSAKSQNYEIQEGRDAGATLYILKPYAPQHLVEEVSRLL
jgi:two-component system alkaline phosphatase synthesis response regulator PhoP